VGARYAGKERAIGAEVMRQHERFVMLGIIDSHWKDHLLAMDHLKEGIGLRGYGQRDPLTEYKRESFDMFIAMKERIEDDIVRYLFLLEPVTPGAEKHTEQGVARRERQLSYSAPAKDGAPAAARRDVSKVGRNDPCPCGSGRKFKRCCALREVRPGA
jgi:preprotein translocase subunit SecA